MILALGAVAAIAVLVSAVRKGVSSDGFMQGAWVPAIACLSRVATDPGTSTAEVLTLLATAALIQVVGLVLRRREDDFARRVAAKEGRPRLRRYWSPCSVVGLAFALTFGALSIALELVSLREHNVLSPITVALREAGPDQRREVTAALTNVTLVYGGVTIAAMGLVVLAPVLAGLIHRGRIKLAEQTYQTELARFVERPRPQTRADNGSAELATIVRENAMQMRLLT